MCVQSLSVISKITTVHMSAKWVIIVIGSLLGAAMLGISIQMLGHTVLKNTDVVLVPPIANDSGQLITGSDLEKSIPIETTTPELAQIVSSNTTSLSAESITSQSTQP